MGFVGELGLWVVDTAASRPGVAAMAALAEAVLGKGFWAEILVGVASAFSSEGCALAALLVTGVRKSEEVGVVESIGASASQPGEGRDCGGG